MNNESPKTPEEQENLKNRILQNTPDGYDPIIYWHQVAIDVLRSQERNVKKNLEEQRELNELRSYKQTEQRRMEHDLKQNSLPCFRDLLGQVQDGNFSMTVTLSFYPNNDRDGDRKERYTDDD